MSYVEIAELWCRGCGLVARFEVIGEMADQQAREWACITCGAAYIEAVESAPTPTPATLDVRGVA